MADDRLHQQARQRRRDPQRRQIVEARPERLEDPAHVRGLKREADLDPEEAERDVPQRRDRLPRLFDRLPAGSFNLPIAARTRALEHLPDTLSGSYRSVRESAR